jgi:hypothetical protein
LLVARRAAEQLAKTLRSHARRPGARFAGKAIEFLIDFMEFERWCICRGNIPHLRQQRPADADAALADGSAQEWNDDGDFSRRDALEQIGQVADLLEASARVGHRSGNGDEVREAHAPMV